MKTIKVNTRFGYFTKDGKIHSKAELPAGGHPMSDEFEYHEVKDKIEFFRKWDFLRLFLPTIRRNLLSRKSRRLSLSRSRSRNQLRKS